MLLTALRWGLVYLTFFQPIIYGSHLCRQVQPDPALVTNTTLALIFGWLMELADVMLLSPLIAMKVPYLLVRIIMCLYFSHPSFLGATRIYEKLFAELVDTYAPILDQLVVQQIEVMGHSGPMTAVSTVGMAAVRGLSEVFHIARILVEAAAVTNVAAAPLRRYSQIQDDRSDTNSLSEEKYATPSIINQARTAQENHDLDIHLAYSKPPPPPDCLQSPNYEDKDINFREVTPPPPRRPPISRRYHPTTDHLVAPDCFEGDRNSDVPPEVPLREKFVRLYSRSFSSGDSGDS